MAKRILVVEDEAPIREMLCFVLEQKGYETIEAEDYADGLAKVCEPYPELIVLDWMMPGGSGIQFIKQLKQDEVTRQIPVVMLTARLHAVMRRVSPTSVDEVIEVQGLKLDPVSHRVSAEERALDMGPTEFKLLHFFMTHPERVYSREQLLNNVWGTNVYVEDRTVDVHIRRLRKAIEETGHDRLIQTVRGAGYRFSTRL
ncbi:winged helix-turn-helix domain-containing protein [Aeromonas salmonicida]|uniref:winged helix-turn-helix domain-containing protein n=1 Tax=Aeromonas salmonicida TaxID=645 RepID=UPI003672B8B4